MTASEVGALLRSGFATGAMTRWRTLHELAVTAFFIAEHDDEVANRFLAYDIVERFRSATVHARYAQRLGEEPFEDDFLKSLNDELTARPMNSDRSSRMNTDGRHPSSEVVASPSLTWSNPLKWRIGAPIPGWQVKEFTQARMEGIGISVSTLSLKLSLLARAISD